MRDELTGTAQHERDPGWDNETLRDEVAARFSGREAPVAPDEPR